MGKQGRAEILFKKANWLVGGVAHNNGIITIAFIQDLFPS